MYREGDRRVGERVEGLQCTFIQYFFLQRVLVGNIENRKTETGKRDNTIQKNGHRRNQTRV